MFELNNFKALNIEQATISLWIFKVSGTSADPRFNGHWVEIGDDVKTEIRSIVISERGRITEVFDYSLLGSTNEASALSISADETFMDRIEANIAAELPVKRADTEAKLLNAAFYVIKILVGGVTVLGVKKTTTNWKTKKAKGIVSVLFTDRQLVLNSDQGFEIARSIDFFVYDEDIAMLNKTNFESVLKYKAAHVDNFNAMKTELEFINIFTTIAPLNDYVANNKIHLRRASTIRLKGHYKDPEFMIRLRKGASTYGLNISFDNTGKIVPTSDTCRDIFQALLDHRLTSGFSLTHYDVQDTQTI